MSLRPVEAYRGHTRADLVRTEERGQCFRQPAEHRLPRAGRMLLFGFDRFPLLEHLARRAHAVCRAEYMRMTPDQLRANGADRIGDGEAPFIRFDLREEHTLE